MLELWQQNGNEIKITVNPISDKGKVGQMVIFGVRVDWGVDSNPTEYPLSQYPYPSIFTIIKKVEDKDGYYILKDAKGNNIKLHYEHGTSYLYDAQEWLTFNDVRTTDQFSFKDKEKEKLKDRLDLLKDILIKQGIHIVTKEQAEYLGIK